MIVIMALGQLVDQLIFRGVESRIRNRWGLAREV